MAMKAIMGEVSPALTRGSWVMLPDPLSRPPLSGIAPPRVALATWGNITVATCSRGEVAPKGALLNLPAIGAPIGAAPQGVGRAATRTSRGPERRTG